jgi:hypothetical protein
MRQRALGAAVVAGVGTAVGAAVVRRVVRRRIDEVETTRSRWHVVTINRGPEELGSTPPPLDRLDFPVEVRIRPAPGGRGSELAARLTRGEPTGIGKVLVKVRNDDPVRQLRKALRVARSLAEIGEVLLPDWPPTTKPRVRELPLAYATRHGREEGRL